jgi:hypothetical protein
MEENNSNQQRMENLAEEVDKIWMEVEEKRPSLKFGVLVVGVAVGSYFGVGRHVVKIGKNVKDIRTLVAGIGQIMAEDSAMRDGQAEIILEALNAGKKIRHFPGVGVWVEGK